MNLELLRHRSHGSRGRIELGDGKARRAHHVVHEFLALVLAALHAFEVARLYLKAQARARPFLGSGDGIAQHLFAGRGLAVVADAKRQVHAHVGVIGQNSKPNLGRHVANAGKHNLVLARTAAQRTRARDIRRGMRCRSAGNLVVKLLGLDLGRVHRLGGTCRRTQAALAADIENVDTAVVNINSIDRAGNLAGVAAAPLMNAGKTTIGIAARLFLIVRRIPMILIRLDAHQRIGDSAQRVLQSTKPLADVDDVVKQVVLLSHTVAALPFGSANKQAPILRYPPRRVRHSVADACAMRS